MPSRTRAALLLASPASGFLAAPKIATSTRRHLATTPDELSFAAHYNSYDYNAESGGIQEDDWRGLALAAGAMEESAENWAGLFMPWDASAEADAENSSLEKIYAVQRDPVNLPPTPQESWGGLFSPWKSDDDDSLDKIYAVQSDPVADVVPRYELGFEPEEVPQAGVAPWNVIQA
jgi:hypothetical protein